MEISTTAADGITVLAPVGRVDTTTSAELEQAINRVIDAGGRRLLLDFSGVTYISSGGLRILLITAKKLRGDGDRYGLCSLSAEVHKVFRLAGFTSIFSIFSSEGEARAAWR